MTAATLIRGVSVWDGERLLDADGLRLAGGRITHVGRGLRPQPDDRLVDGGGAFALPGLIDAHVHLELDPAQSAPPAADAPRDLDAMAARAGAMVRAGITTARDLGGGQGAELILRDRIAAGTVPGPRLLCAGQPVTTPGGHCHFWGGEAADLDAARAVIDRQLARGVDLIKVMATGGMFTRGSHPAAAQFDLDTLTGIVAAAAAADRPVAAHCHGVDGIEFAARAGVRTIEHCSWMGADGWAGNYDEAIAGVILSRGAWVSPTVNRGWQRYLDAPDPTKLRRIRSAFQAMMALGIPFVASTDAGIPGVRHDELAQALEVFRAILETTPETVLRTATSAAAQGIGLESVTGRLAPGMAADLLLVDGDPLQDLAALTRPVAVWAAGRLRRSP
ncbi:MAG: amidohydrolase [Gammaproteobacteria bacterium]|nr:amidohydrolase [Gammaproteobacteria bacterium]